MQTGDDHAAEEKQWRPLVVESVVGWQEQVGRREQARRTQVVVALVVEPQHELVARRIEPLFRRRPRRIVARHVVEPVVVEPGRRGAQLDEPQQLVRPPQLVEPRRVLQPRRLLEPRRVLEPR
jgi:hypothetical protein